MRRRKRQRWIQQRPGPDARNFELLAAVGVCGNDGDDQWYAPERSDLGQVQRYGSRQFCDNELNADYRHGGEWDDDRGDYGDHARRDGGLAGQLQHFGATDNYQFQSAERTGRHDGDDHRDEFHGHNGGVF